MSLSVIIPTIGRPTLTDTLLSILPQLHIEDEIIVYADGLLNLGELIQDLDPRIRYGEMHPTHDYGNTQRDRAQELAKGTHLVYADDDDIMSSNALAYFRRAVKADPLSIWLFKMFYGQNSQSPGLVLWNDQHVRKGNLGTPMFLIPNQPDLPNWAGAKQLEYSDFIYLINRA